MKFKVLLYTEFEKANHISGLGKAILHQEQALGANGIPYTKNPRDDYDIIHMNTYGPYAYHLVKSAKRAGKKVVYHAHSTEEDFRNSFILSNEVSPLFKKWLIKCYKLGDIILTPTEYSKKLLEGYGLKNVHAISNGVDTEFFQKDVEAGKNFRKSYGFKPSDKVVVGIGLYLKRKGILDFIELARRMPDVKFIWFGHTPSITIPFEINKAIRTAPKNIQFPGHVPANMIKSALSGCDLYIFPTYEETEGIPIVEACSVGTTTLIRDIPVFDPWMKDGVNTYKAKTLDEFEEKARKILSGELKNLGNEARKVALDRDIKKTGRELVKFYEQVLR